MALKITYINEEAPSPKVTASERLFRTADDTRLVPDGHPEAAFLFCAPGQEVAKAEFERYELDPALGDVATEESERGEAAAAEGAADEGGEPTELAGDEVEEPDGEAKAVEGPEEDKAVRKRRTKSKKAAA